MTSIKDETPQERAVRLSSEVDRAQKNSYTPGEVKAILNSISQMPSREVPFGVAEDAGTCRLPVEFPAVRRGDVFIARTVGGKVRPWVTLRVRGEIVYAVALSSKDTSPGVTPSRCRYWPNSFLGITVAAFAMDTARQEVTRPYTAHSHLVEVEEALASVLRPTKPKTAKIVPLRKQA